jgi:hypothetical protein
MAVIWHTVHERYDEAYREKKCWGYLSPFVHRIDPLDDSYVPSLVIRQGLPRSVLSQVTQKYLEV